METERLLPRSQDASTGPYPEAGIQLIPSYPSSFQNYPPIYV
jgi:hypothetical protein